MSVKKSKALEPQQVSDIETQILLELLSGCLALDGDAVELGCYRGDTSVLFKRKIDEFNRINQNKINKPDEEDSDFGSVLKRLWIYDSFEGLPAKTIEDNSVAGDQFKKGELLVTKREVIEKFKRAGLRPPIIKKGFFDQLNSETDFPEKICFGFLDGDLYSSIKTSLELCVPKIVDGGILVVHDYNNSELPGVSKIVDEFMRKPTKFGARKSPKLEVKQTLAILKF